MNGKYALEERTSRFGISAIKFCRLIREDTINKPLISQLVRSATSIGANYREANAASSKKDFKNKIHICKKEAQETIHWITMMAESEQSVKEAARILWKEAQELTFIFGKILSSLKLNNSEL